MAIGRAREPENVRAFETVTCRRRYHLRRFVGEDFRPKARPRVSRRRRPLGQVRREGTPSHESLGYLGDQSHNYLLHSKARVRFEFRARVRLRLRVRVRVNVKV